MLPQLRIFVTLKRTNSPNHRSFLSTKKNVSIICIIRLVLACRLLLTDGGGFAYNEEKHDRPLDSLILYRQGGTMAIFALCRYKKTGRLILTLYCSAKNFDFLTIITKGTHDHCLNCKRFVESLELSNNSREVRSGDEAVNRRNEPKRTQNKGVYRLF